MTDLCRHERETLRWVLKKSASSWADEYAKLVRLPLSDSTFEPKRNALSAIHDPAKLAEMLAERGRELGLSIAIYDNHRRFRMSGAPVVYALLVAVDGVSIQDRDKRGWDLDMPQARAILLQWLQLPDGAREEALKVLRGEP